MAIVTTIASTTVTELFTQGLAGTIRSNPLIDLRQRDVNQFGELCLGDQVGKERRRRQCLESARLDRGMLRLPTHFLILLAHARVGVQFRRSALPQFSQIA
mgnify:CR=1 FL=1